MHIVLRLLTKVKSDHRSKFPILEIGRKKPEKHQGFNGIRTRDLRDTCAMLDQLSTLHFHLLRQYKYEFHVHFTSFHCTGRYELNKLTSLAMCGFTAQLVEHRTGIAEVTGSNPVEALIFFRLLHSNCLNWKFTAMITHFHLQRQYNMHFIYISTHCYLVYSPKCTPKQKGYGCRSVAIFNNSNFIFNMWIFVFNNQNCIQCFAFAFNKPKLYSVLRICILIN